MGDFNVLIDEEIGKEGFLDGDEIISSLMSVINKSFRCLYSQNLLEIRITF